MSQLKSCFCGDSISLGENALKRTNAPPFCPAFGELTALALEQHYGGKIAFTNKAVDGTTSNQGLQLAKDGQITKLLPDLAIIAYE
jgi:hypothetical protein